MYSTLISLPEFHLTDIPTGLSEWRYPKMYKRDMKGKRREWFAAVIAGGVVTSHGEEAGVKTISEPYAVELNQSGRSFAEQAALELRSRYEVKHRKEGYRFPGEFTVSNIKPMLANDWLKRLKSTKIYYPAAIQPKLDGTRCLVKQDPDSCRMIYRSRTNKEGIFGYLFDQELLAMLPFFPFQVEFDGELYIHGVSRQTIHSIVSLKTTREDIANGKIKGSKLKHAIETLDRRDQELKYNIFTIITPKELPYEDRNDLLHKAYMLGQESLGRPFEKIVLVEDHIVNSESELDEAFRYYTEEQKYEGIMIYKLGISLPIDKIKESYYRSGRSWNLIKYKPYFDEEMTIIAVKGGKGKAADKAGCVVQDSEGITHNVNIADDDEVKKAIFDNPELVLGKKATVKFYGRTDDGKLDFATIIAIEDYE